MKLSSYPPALSILHLKQLPGEPLKLHRSEFHRPLSFGELFDTVAQLFIQLLYAFLRVPASGQVARDLRESEQLAIIVAHSADADRSPEGGAVFLDTPSLVGKAAHLFRDL